MNIEAELIYIDARIDELDEILSQKDKTWDFSKPYDKYEAYRASETSEIRRLSTRRRMIMPYELSELPDYGDVMSLEDFKNAVKNGWFIDYDGFGHYVKDNQETNIEIYPSDIKANQIRPEFDTIIWFNR